MSRELEGEEGHKILQNIKLIRQRTEPEVLAQEEAQKLRKARAAARLYRAPEVGASLRLLPPN